MNEPSKTLHVNPVGKKWEVESVDPTLGETTTEVQTKDEAVVLASELASGPGGGTIEVHKEDGKVEKKIPVQEGQTSE